MSTECTVQLKQLLSVFIYLIELNLVASTMPGEERESINLFFTFSLSLSFSFSFSMIAEHRGCWWSCWCWCWWGRLKVGSNTYSAPFYWRCVPFNGDPCFSIFDLFPSVCLSIHICRLEVTPGWYLFSWLLSSSSLTPTTTHLNQIVTLKIDRSLTPTTETSQSY